MKAVRLVNERYGPVGQVYRVPPLEQGTDFLCRDYDEDDEEEEFWTLWRRGYRLVDYAYIDLTGHAGYSPVEYTGEWGNGVRFYPVTTDERDMLIAAAVMLGGDQWYELARKISRRRKRQKENENG